MPTADARRVDAQRTPISAAVAREAIARAFAELSGEPLNESAQSILTAQWAHETGHGSSMFNFNFGGIKGVGPSGLTVSQRTREGYGANERQVVDKFRAYSSIDEGAKDYVRLLIGRYGDAVAAARQGDAKGFVQGLKRRGYFTGDPVAYEKSITSVAKQLTAPGTSQLVEFVSQAHLPKSVLPSSGTRTAFPSVDGRALLSQMQSTRTLLAAPQPSALLQNSDDGADEEFLTGGVDGLSAVSALSMADELARSALRLATEDAERRRAVATGGGKPPV